MTGFSFDPTPPPGTNRSAAPSDCELCGGDRLIQLPVDDAEVYARCPTCNAGPTREREPVAENAWWKE